MLVNTWLIIRSKIEFTKKNKHNTPFVSMTNPAKEIFEILAPYGASVRVLDHIGTNLCEINQVSANGHFEKWTLDIRLIDGVYYYEDSWGKLTPIWLPLDEFLVGYFVIVGAL